MYSCARRAVLRERRTSVCTSKKRDYEGTTYPVEGLARGDVVQDAPGQDGQLSRAGTLLDVAHDGLDGVAMGRVGRESGDEVGVQNEHRKSQVRSEGERCAGNRCTKVRVGAGAQDACGQRDSDTNASEPKFGYARGHGRPVSAIPEPVGYSV